MYVHEVLVNRLGGLSLPRKSVVRLTDRPDMTLDVYHGRKATMQQQQQPRSRHPRSERWIYGPACAQKRFMDLEKNSIMKANSKKYAHVLLYMPMPVFDGEVDCIMKDFFGISSQRKLWQN